VLPLISVLASGWPIGFASAPYDPRWAAQHPRRAAWMALAGPGANLTLLLLSAAVIRIGLGTGAFVAPDAISFDHVVIASGTSGAWHALAFMTSVMFSLNLLLATFNLLPLPPLDGSGAVPLVAGVEAGRRYLNFIRSQQAFGFLGLFLAWRLFDWIFHPLWLFVVNLVHPMASYG
jgi:Zn-dependent protease